MLSPGIEGQGSSCGKGLVSVVLVGTLQEGVVFEVVGTEQKGDPFARLKAPHFLHDSSDEV